MPHPAPIIQPNADAEYAQKTLALLGQYGVPPIPENYAVWFQYAIGKNKDLVHEIDSAIAHLLPFTPETCLYLYNKYIIGSHARKAADDAAAAHKALVEVLRVINDFSGETQNYNKDINQYLSHIDKEFQDENINKIFKELFDATSIMKQSGETITRKLEESTHQIDDLKKNLRQITSEAQHDFLTSLYNRKTFELFTDEHMKTARETNTNLCLLMIDIDHFKTFNDRFGHLLGDEVLKIVARTLTELVKGRDMVARFGGEEFVVVLPETPVEGAMKVAEILRTAIASKELKRKDTGEQFGKITISVGVAHFRPQTDTLPILIKRADDAMYASKNHGRNRVSREGVL